MPPGRSHSAIQGNTRIWRILRQLGTHTREKNGRETGRWLNSPLSFCDVLADQSAEIRQPMLRR